MSELVSLVMTQQCEQSWNHHLGLFTYIICRANLGVSWPPPSSLRQQLSSFGSSPKQCLVCYSKIPKYHVISFEKSRDQDLSPFPGSRRGLILTDPSMLGGFATDHYKVISWRILARWFPDGSLQGGFPTDPLEAAPLLLSWSVPVQDSNVSPVLPCLSTTDPSGSFLPHKYPLYVL